MAAVRPLLESGARIPFLRMSQQERFDAFWELHGTPTVEPTAVSRQREGADGVNTLNAAPMLHVTELLYPGDDIREPFGKYVYVFDLDRKSCIVEATADPHPGRTLKRPQWRYRWHPDQALGDPLDASASGVERCMDFLPIPAYSSSRRDPVGVYLSPIRLSKDALAYLKRNLPRAGAAPSECGAVVRPKWQSLTSGTVSVPDPFHWAALAHEKWYRPALERWRDYALDTDRAARKFTASVLSAWTGSGDPMGVENELREDPKTILEQIEDEERKLKESASEALAYVIFIADSVEHFAAEQAGMDRGEQDLSTCFQQWFVISRYLTQLPVGDQFACEIASGTGAGSDRLPARFLFSQSSPSNSLEFAQYRYAFLAAKDTFAELIVPRLKSEWSQPIPPRSEIERQRSAVLGYLDNLASEYGEEFVKGTYRQIRRDLKRGQSIGRGKRSRYRVLRSYNKLVRKAGKAPVTLQDVKAARQKAVDAAHADVQGMMKGVGMSIAGIIEIVNLALAIQDYRSAEKHDRDVVPVLGATADLLVFTSEATGTLAREGSKAATWFKGGQGALTVIAGVLEAYDHAAKAGTAHHSRDWGALSGSTIAVGGAALSTVGGGMALASAISSAVGGAALFAGPVGAILAVIGAGLILLGSWIHRKLTSNPFEEFARFSSFGEEHYEQLGSALRHSGHTLYRDWAHETIGTRNLQQEARNAFGMICAFQLQVTGGGEPWDNPLNFLEIIPGHVPFNSVFRVRMDQSYFDGQTHRSLWAEIEVHDDDERIVQFFEGRPGEFMIDSSASSIERGDNGEITRIRIQLRPWLAADEAGGPPFFFYEPRRRGKYLYWVPSKTTKSEVRVQLVVDDTMSIPAPGDRWLRVETRSLAGSTVSSFASANWAKIG